MGEIPEIQGQKNICGLDLLLLYITPCLSHCTVPLKIINKVKTCVDLNKNSMNCMI